MLFFVRKSTSTHASYVVIRPHGEANKNKMIGLHRVITEAKKGERVDFKNLDTLDLRRENLRACSYSEKACHVPKKSQNKRFKGVFYDRRHGTYYAQIAICRVRHSRHGFTTEEEAAAAYDELAREFHGEFALTNEQQQENEDGQRQR